MHSITSAFPPLHPEGYRFVAIFAAISLLLFWIWSPLGWIGVILTGWCAYFFRDPARVPPEGDGLVVSPADGVVSQIVEAQAPSDLGLGDKRFRRISVFMNVFNCHVNRAPVAGRIEHIGYRPGKFFNASLDKASEDNERNAVVLERPDGTEIIVVQIAGLVARRIVCTVEEGDHIGLGVRFGMIRFGSRLDVYLPPDAEISVRVGQTMVAGETVLARLHEGQSA